MTSSLRVVRLAILAALLCACSPEHPSDTVASLTEDPDRLKEVRRLCREERAKVGEEVCRRAAEATNQRFFGNRPEQRRQ